MERILPYRFAYEAIWKCIYCGSTERKSLTKEHIVPVSFGGKVALPKSSCVSCARITRDFEKDCARKNFGRLRMYLNFPTRHPDQRPSHIPILVETDGKTEEVLVERELAPTAPFLLPVFKSPSIFGDGAPADAFENVQFMMILPLPDDHKNRIERLKKKPTAQVKIPWQFDLNPFVRMLAKISHATAVAEFGLDSFSPLLVPAILGDSPPTRYLIGCSKPLRKPLGGREFEFEIGHMKTKDGRDFLCAKIQMFTFVPGSPTYIVVIGVPEDRLLRHLVNPLPPSSDPLRSGKRFFARYKDDRT